MYEVMLQATVKMLNILYIFVVGIFISRLLVDSDGDSPDDVS